MSLSRFIIAVVWIIYSLKGEDADKGGFDDGQGCLYLVLACIGSKQASTQEV